MGGDTANASEVPAHVADVHTLGRYRLLKKIARGGMAEVYAARSFGAHGFEKTVAIKRILARYSTDPQFVRMMVDEAKITVLLNHPNVATILELAEQAEDYFIVMEFVPGTSLQTVRKRIAESSERVPDLEAAFIVMETLQGLHAAHVQTDSDGAPAHIIHRDVSPQNVLVSFEGHVKVIDFGIARARDRLEDTQTGTIKGKLRYLAPEMIDPDRFMPTGDFDHRVDVFAAGIVLWELIANRTLYQGDDELKVYDAITDVDAPDLAQAGLCDGDLAAIVKKALTRQPAERFLTAEAFADALRTYIYKKDPAFTPRRIAQLLERHFPDEKVEMQGLERGQVAGHSVDVALFGKGKSKPKSTSQPSARVSAGADVKPAAAPIPASLFADAAAVRADADDPEPSMLTVATLVSRIKPPTPAEQRARADAFDNRGTDTAVPTGDITLIAPDADVVQVPPVVVAKAAADAPAPSLVSATGLVRRKMAPQPQAPVREIATDAPIDRDALGVPRLKKRFLFVAALLGLLTTLLVVALGRPAPTVVKGVNLRVLCPPQAQVSVAGKTQACPGVFWVKPRDVLVVSVSANGFLPFEQQVPVASTAAVDIDVPVVLQAVAAAPAAPVVDVQPVSPALETPKPLVPKKPGKPLPKTGEVAVQAPTGVGTLKIVSKPYWGQVAVDGKLLDDTTPVAVELSAGRHKVTVTHPPLSLRQERTVTVVPGKTMTVSIQFEAP